MTRSARRDIFRRLRRKHDRQFLSRPGIDRPESGLNSLAVTLHTDGLGAQHRRAQRSRCANSFLEEPHGIRIVLALCSFVERAPASACVARDSNVAEDSFHLLSRCLAPAMVSMSDQGPRWMARNRPRTNPMKSSLTGVVTPCAQRIVRTFA